MLMSSIYVPTRSGEKIKSIIHRADIPTPSGVGVILVAGAGGGLSGPSWTLFCIRATIIK